MSQFASGAGGNLRGGRFAPASFAFGCVAWVARYFALFAAFIIGAGGARAAGNDASPPPVKTVLVITSGLSLANLRPGGPLPSVRALANRGGVALLNTAVAGEPTDAAAFLSVGASERMSAPQTGGPRFTEADIALSADDLAREAYPARGPGSGLTGAVYRRRFGATMPGAAVVHLGLPALMRAQSLPSRAILAGAFGDALEQAGLRVAAVGDYRAALAAMNRAGAVAQGTLIPAPASQDVLAALRAADVVIAVPSTVGGAERIARVLAPLADAGSVRIVFASVAPPRNAENTKWARLGFVVVCGPEIAPGGVLMSPTTRTPGLAANIDLAPFVLALAAPDYPAPAFGGRPLSVLPTASGEAWAIVARLDRQVNAATAATVPVLVTYGVWAIGSGIAALVVLLTRAPSARLVGAAKFGLLVSASVLIAFLPVGVIAPLSPVGFGLLTFAIAVVLAGGAWILAPRVNVSPLALLLAFAAVIVSVDAAFGSPLVSRALLSNFYLAGIRFYGIGNEYMGLTIGGALVGGAMLTSVKGDSEAPPLLGAGGAFLRPPLALLLLAPLTLCAVGLPFFGADAGGAIGATVTYTVAFFGLRARRLQLRHIVAAFAIAGVVVVALAFADRARPASARTHVGAAIATGQARGMGAIAEIAARKIAMNAGIAVHPATLAAVLLLAPMAWAVGRGPLADRTRRALDARPVLRRAVLPAGAWGAFASFVFNDSGVVAALLLLAPVLVMVFYVLLDDAAPLPPRPTLPT